MVVKVLSAGFSNSRGFQNFEEFLGVGLKILPENLRGLAQKAESEPTCRGPLCVFHAKLTPETKLRFEI
jgi:hypothetical protein